MGEVLTARPTCKNDLVVLNTRTSVIHPCDCQTFNTLVFPNVSGFYKVFNSRDEAFQYAKLNKLQDVRIPDVCSRPEAPPSPATAITQSPQSHGQEFTVEFVRYLLTKSQGRKGVLNKNSQKYYEGHPLAHIPLNGPGGNGENAHTYAKSLAQERSRVQGNKTGVYISPEDGLADVLEFMNEKRDLINALKPGDTIANESNYIQLSTPHKIYESFNGSQPTKPVEAKYIVVIIQRLVEGPDREKLHIVTAFPRTTAPKRDQEN